MDSTIDHRSPSIDGGRYSQYSLSIHFRSISSSISRQGKVNNDGKTSQNCRQSRRISHYRGMRSVEWQTYRSIVHRLCYCWTMSCLFALHRVEVSKPLTLPLNWLRQSWRQSNGETFLGLMRENEKMDSKTNLAAIIFLVNVCDCWLWIFRCLVNENKIDCRWWCGTYLYQVYFQLECPLPFQ